MVEPNFSGQVVVVTNAAHGTGLDIARRFQEAGATVIIAAPEAQQHTAALDALRALGVPFAFESLDQGSHATSSALVERVVSRYNRIDVWVNAPELVQNMPAESISPTEWEACLGTLLSGTFYGCQAAGRHMLKQGQGVIVNLGSVNGLKVIEGHVANATAEAGIFMLTQALGVEWSGRGVRVVGVATGPSGRDSKQKFLAHGQPPSDTVQRVPLHRLASSKNIADVVLFAAGPQASFITGETLRVDGGWVAYQLF